MDPEGSDTSGLLAQLGSRVSLTYFLIGSTQALTLTITVRVDAGVIPVICHVIYYITLT